VKTQQLRTGGDNPELRKILNLHWPISGRAGQSAHILLIEDNPGDADLVRVHLLEANSDLPVSCVNRLSDGLVSLGNDPPVVVLLDLDLPDSKGAETFRKILNEAPGIPVVILSGQYDEEFAASAIHQGVQDYLVKGTFDEKQLIHALRYAIERQAGTLLKTARAAAISKGRYYTKKPIKGATAFTCSFCEHSVTTRGFNNSGGNRRTQAVATMNRHVSLFHTDQQPVLKHT
jgi:DNA-binding NarL/FixJ family response regulator